MSKLTIKQCYDDLGLLRKNDVPCDPNAEVSACCGTGGSQCIDNLHCINPQGGSVPGTCTFSSWVSGTEPACPCPPIYVGNNTALDYRDGVTMCPDGGFVCGASNFDACNQGESLPIINYGLAGDKIPATTSHNPTSVLSTYYAGLAVSTESISRATSSGTSTSASATSTTNLPSSSTATASSSSSDSLSTGAKAGIGIGAAAVVLLLIASIAFFLIRRKRKQRRVNETAAMPAAQPYYDYSQHQQPPPPQPAVKYEKDAGPPRQWQPPSELDSTNRSPTGRQMYR